VSGYQTASSSKGRANLQQQQQQQQQSKMYTRGASQALAGKKCRRPAGNKSYNCCRPMAGCKALWQQQQQHQSKI
jgi:hypothetical protein